MYPTVGKGGHIGISADPVGVGVRVGVSVGVLLLLPYLLKNWTELHKTCMDIPHLQSHKRTRICGIFIVVTISFDQTDGISLNEHGYIIRTSLRIYWI